MKIATLKCRRLAIAAALASTLAAATAHADNTPATVTLAELKEAVSRMEQRGNRLNDEIDVSVRNQRVRLFSDNKRTSATIWSYDVYRMGVQPELAVFDHGVRIPLSTLQGQLGQAKADHIAVSTQDDRLVIASGIEQADGSHVVRVADLRGLVKKLQADRVQWVEFISEKGGDALTFAVPTNDPAIATVYNVNAVDSQRTAAR